MSNYLNLLGLANRARKLVHGEGTIVEGIRNKQVKLVLIAEDATDNTTKEIKQINVKATSPLCHHRQPSSTFQSNW